MEIVHRDKNTSIRYFLGGVPDCFLARLRNFLESLLVAWQLKQQSGKMKLMCSSVV